MSWYYKPTRPIETTEGIKAKSKRGDFVQNWWASRWIKAMERVMDRGRLQRGRRYARRGQVLALEEGRGQVTARVQGSRRTPYKITIELKPLSEQDWTQVLNALADRPVFLAQLLAGEMPPEIEEAFQAVKLDLFPRREELHQHCNCPDWAEVCKHLAAVHYILGERFDEDPFLLFRLRGKNQEQLLSALGDSAVEMDTVDVPDYGPSPPLMESLDDFWQLGSDAAAFSVNIARPEIMYPLLERLGEPDFMPEARRWFEKTYDMVTQTTLQTAYPDLDMDNELT